MPRIGVLSFYDPPSAAEREGSPFWQGMHELGWGEGQNISIERRYAEGRADRLPALAAELVQLPVDVIVATGPQETRAAKAASDTIPIVFTGVGDPVRVGFVASLARPGGNMTGLSSMSPELSGNRMELLKEAVPGISHVAVLTNSSVNYLLADMERSAQLLGVTLHPVFVQELNELDQAFTAMMAARVDALIVLTAPLFIWQWRRVLDLATQSGLPAMYPLRRSVVAGGLMSYGPDLAVQGWRAVYYVDKILKGAKPGDLPVEQPTKYELVINLKTAQALGLTIPPSVLFQATEVIR
jgi:putative ABC transport system substrate-binding protein